MSKYSEMLTSYLNELPGVKEFEVCPQLEVYEITVEYRIEGMLKEVFLEHGGTSKEAKMGEGKEDVSELLQVQKCSISSTTSLSAAR
jgi:hypothetical protein